MFLLAMFAYIFGGEHSNSLHKQFVFVNEILNKKIKNELFQNFSCTYIPVRKIYRFDENASLRNVRTSKLIVPPAICKTDRIEELRIAKGNVHLKGWILFCYDIYPKKNPR